MVVFRDISEQKKTERKLQQANKLLHQLSISDGLTGIPNRRYFEEMYKLKWEEAQASQKPLSLIIFDIDFFKKFNDSYGHLEGDKCLKIVANTVSKIIDETSDFCARFGGEEFIGICDTDKKGAYIIAEKIRNSVLDLQIPNMNSGVNQFVTISIGVVSLVPNISMKMEDAIDYSDKALYTAKLNGRNQVHFYHIENEIFA
ncbi:GGDEF domain-containing protein [Bacillus sp. JJ664]